MKAKLIYLAGILVLSVSCKTYTVPVDSFRKQMTVAGSEKLKEVEIDHPTFYSSSSPGRNLRYQSNTIKSIEVLDKNGTKVWLENSPKLEMRIHKKDGKKHILYFDSVVVENDTLKGARSRLMDLRREIAMSDIEKIEIQDSGKTYTYQ
ncbi:MAG TPA: hypothetical protein VK921_12560 [Anditalea sp.]|nr:hypothetical protein [Anditalea sp.]